MITAKQAYANHVRWKVYSQIEKFVHSVLELIITDENIKSHSRYEKQMDISIEYLLHKVFLCEEKNRGEYNIIGWSADYSELPIELKGKHIRRLVKELEQVYEVDPQISFICKWLTVVTLGERFMMEKKPR